MKIAQGGVRRSERNPGMQAGQNTHRPRGPNEIRDHAFAVPLSFIMSHTYCSSLFHCVFSTKERRRSISPEIQERLWPYIGGIARNHGMRALSVGGSDDHVHILLSMPSSIAIAQALRIIKSESSRWTHDVCGRERFEWQEGYGAFSIGYSQIEATLAYIAGQQEHHKRHDFQAEFIAFLTKNQIEYDPRYVWG